jgi:hypothetical protein
MAWGGKICAQFFGQRALRNEQRLSGSISKMSMEHCSKHGRNFDTDFHVDCPECEIEDHDEHSLAPYKTPDFIATETGEVVFGAAWEMPSVHTNSAAIRHVDRRARHCARKWWFKRLGKP